MSDITIMFWSLTHLPPRSPARWGRHSALSPTSALRVEVCPPSLRCAPGSAWQRLVFWLMAPAPQEAAPPMNRLPAVREEFLVTLADIGSDEAAALRCRISQSQSLRELWHVRAELFRIVGITHNQTEAEQRLFRLNRHFPTRAPRSQFAPL